MFCNPSFSKWGDSKRTTNKTNKTDGNKLTPENTIMIMFQLLHENTQLRNFDKRQNSDIVNCAENENCKDSATHVAIPEHCEM